jgi:hypothetical protein
MPLNPLVRAPRCRTTRHPIEGVWGATARHSPQTWVRTKWKCIGKSIAETSWSSAVACRNISASISGGSEKMRLGGCCLGRATVSARSERRLLRVTSDLGAAGRPGTKTTGMRLGPQKSGFERRRILMLIKVREGGQVWVGKGRTYRPPVGSSDSLRPSR